MYSEKITIMNKTGLHARPAADFVKTAKNFISRITVVCEGNEANAKSIISIMTLGAGQGKEITIKAEGADEEEAVAALVEVVKHADV